MEDALVKAAVTRLKGGDIGGLAVLVTAYQVQAVRAAYLITRDRAQAEDIVQAAFVRVYERIHQFDPNRPFAPYFMRVVVNDALAAVKQQERQRSLDDPITLDEDAVTLQDLLPDSALSPDGSIEAAELRDAVEAALNRLSSEQRAAVVLRYYLGLSESDMAGRLDIPPGTVKWRLHAARKQLRALLRPFGAAPVMED